VHIVGATRLHINLTGDYFWMLTKYPAPTDSGRCVNVCRAARGAA
jgi:hypothetical protein